MDSNLEVVKGFSFRTDQLFEWVKLKKLGSGGFGDVYLASITKPVPRLVAVKYCPSPSPSLQKEYRVLRQFLDSPNIIQCYGETTSIEHKATVHHNLFLEYANGGNLLNLIKTYVGKIPESEVRYYTKLIGEGLCCVHEKGYVHCDIKQENILVFYGSNQWGRLSTLKITDFGLAKEPGEREEDALVSPYIRGTFNYMPPEAVMNGTISAAMDIWSLGWVVVEMMTGKMPSEETYFSSPDIISSRIMSMMCGNDLKDFLMRCFVRDPNQRWTSKRLLTHEFLCPNYTHNRVVLPHELMHQNRNSLIWVPRVVHRC